MVEIEIDGKKVEVEEGSMIIEAADQVGIKIPRFCYHKKLSIAANCRMCLVDVAKAPKPLPACATPVTSGMCVNTQSKFALEAQKAVMEFLLINHPLDCPICDQGGECELQDVALGYGQSVSRFTEGKRSVADENIGPLIETDMTRCIQCTRCVRFGDEIAGVRELGTLGRGEHMAIGTYVQQKLKSEMSGNVIDLCPVGALTSKPFRYKARAWELEQFPSIAPHDCIGSNVNIHTRNNKVMRVVPRENEAINETWISDRDRFSYEGLYHDRITTPMIKKNGHWEETDWKTALNTAVEGLQRIIHNDGAGQIGAFISPSSTTEECYLLQKLLRQIGCHNIDFRLHQEDFSDQYHENFYPCSDIDLEQLENQKSIVIIGSNIRCEQPIAHHRIRKASLKGAKISSINPGDFDFRFKQCHRVVTNPYEIVRVVAGVAKALLLHPAVQNDDKYAAQNLLKDIEPIEIEQQIAEQLLNDEHSVLVLGAFALNHPHAATLKALTELIASLTQSHTIYFTEGANVSGAWLAGAVPHQTTALISVPKPGLDAKRMWQSNLKSYILFGVEPPLDCNNSYLAKSALNNAEFVVALSAFKGKLFEYADVILPIVPFTETSGTYINVTGLWQSFTGVVPALGEARPGWKVLRVLGNLLHLEEFNYASSQDVYNEIKKMTDGMSGVRRKDWKYLNYLPQLPELHHDELYKITEWSIYRVDSLVRRSHPLQTCGASGSPVLKVNAKVAEKYGLASGQTIKVKENKMELSFPVEIDNSIPDHCLYVPAGFEETSDFADAFAIVKIQKG